AVSAVTLIGSMKKAQMAEALPIHMSHGCGALPRIMLKKVKMAISDGAATASRAASDRCSLRAPTISGANGGEVVIARTPAEAWPIHMSRGCGALPRIMLKKVKMAISDGAATASRAASDRFSLRASTISGAKRGVVVITRIPAGR